MSNPYSNQLVFLTKLLEEKQIDPNTIAYIHSEMEKEFQRVKADMPIGVNALILNDHNEILLSKRGEIAFCGGTWGLPGGHLQQTETFEEGIAREC
jgi:hypothetical protein